mmetsp:Transcript_1082/g.1562  ORF Transcript_1082/g.1562 Transcript_1082/m.1562 type:complete len:169 (-) Transcript_1082:2582-3088(-)
MTRAARITLTAPAAFIQYVSRAYRDTATIIGEGLKRKLENNEATIKALLRKLLTEENSSEVDDNAVEEEYIVVHSHFIGQDFLTEDEVIKYWFNDRLSRDQRRKNRLEIQRKQKEEEDQKLAEIAALSHHHENQQTAVVKQEKGRTIFASNPFSGFFATKKRKKKVHK